MAELRANCHFWGKSTTASAQGLGQPALPPVRTVVPPCDRQGGPRGHQETSGCRYVSEHQRG